MDKKSKLILAQYAQDSLKILDKSIALYQEGNESFYRVAATQLRLLLCDTSCRHGKTVDIALIPVLLPNLLLIPLDDQAHPQLNFAPIDLKHWLDSPAGTDTGLSVRQFIRRVCDIDGGAHVDIKPLAGLPKLGDTHQWIINLSKYISTLLSQALPE